MAAWLIAGGGVAAASAEPLVIGRQISHPGGVSLTLNTFELRGDSIVLAVTIANPTDHEVRLNRARSFVLDDGAGGVHRLNPPLDNPQLRIPPHQQATAELVFIGPLTPAAHSLALSSNKGVGTPDNPYDDAPVLQATWPVVPETAADRYQASHPDGVTLRVIRLLVGPGGCVASLRATNGNEQTVVLNENHSLALSDGSGATARVAAPSENAELVVPPGDRLDAALVFDCRTLDTAGRLTLSVNHGTAGTTDNPFDTLPAFSFSMTGERVAPGSTTSTASHASVTPIARSRIVTTAAIGESAEPPPPAPAPAPAAAPSPAAQPPASGASAAPAASVPPAAPAPVGDHAAGSVAEPGRSPKTVPQLEAALHAIKDARGLHVVLSADLLFDATRDTLAASADPPLTLLARLIAAKHPHLIVVAGHTDSVGNDADNLSLSKVRAHAVAAWLEAHAAKKGPRLVERGYGRTRPVAPNHRADGSDNPEGRERNRRIEVTLH